MRHVVARVDGCGCEHSTGLEQDHARVVTLVDILLHDHGRRSLCDDEQGGQPDGLHTFRVLLVKSDWRANQGLRSSKPPSSGAYQTCQLGQVRFTEPVNFGTPWCRRVFPNRCRANHPPLVRPGLACHPNSAGAVEVQPRPQETVI